MLSHKSFKQQLKFKKNVNITQNYEDVSLMCDENSDYILKQ